MKPKRTHLILAANESTGVLVANGHDGGAVFAVTQEDSMFIPYGEFRHKVGMQVFDRQAAEDMIAANQKPLAKLARVFGAAGAEIPIYVGHPDIPGTKDNDKRAFGWASTSSMVAENEGLRIPVRWSDAGSALVSNGHFRFYSPVWWLAKTRRGMVPTGLKSIGLTNDPNIPVPALANEAETQDFKTQDPREEESQTIEHEEPMKPEILAALGLEDGATPDEVLAAINALAEKAAAKPEPEAETPEETEPEETEPEEDPELLKAEKLAADEKCQAAENELATANEKITAMEGALKLAANHAVESAVCAGKLTPAEAPAKVEEILAANDLAEALHELGKLPAKVKTASTTGDLGTAKARLVIAANDATAVAKAERAQLVANEYEGINPALSHGARKRLAWQRAQAKHPALFSKSPAEQA